MAATIPNPATAATAHKKLTLDVIQLFYSAWTESKTIHPVPKTHLLSLKAIRLSRARNPKRPAPDTSTGEHIKIFKKAKTTHAHNSRDNRPAVYAARNNTHSHSSSLFTSHTPPLPFKPGNTQWSQPSVQKLTTRHNHLEKHIDILRRLQALTKRPPLMKPCENSPCTRPAAKNWKAKPNKGSIATSIDLCKECRTRSELAHNPNRPALPIITCEICGTTTPHGYNWLKHGERTHLCTLCFTCEATADRTPFSHLLPSPPVTRPDMRAIHCALCQKSPKSTPTSFFQHKLCPNCTNHSPNAHQTMQARITFFATRHFHVPLSKIHTESLVALASQLLLNRSIPMPSNTHKFIPVLTQPAGPHLAALLAALQLDAVKPSATYSPPSDQEFSLILYRLTLPTPSHTTLDAAPFQVNHLPHSPPDTPTHSTPTTTQASHTPSTDSRAHKRKPTADTTEQPHTGDSTPTLLTQPPLLTTTIPTVPSPPDGARRPRPSHPTDPPASPPTRRIRRIGPKFAQHRPFSSPPTAHIPQCSQRPAESRSSSILRDLFGPIFSGNPPPPVPPHKGLPRSLRRPRQATSWAGEEAVRSAIFDLNPTRHKRRRAPRPATATQQPPPQRDHLQPPSAAEPSGIG
jgi:hypothetical protein